MTASTSHLDELNSRLVHVANGLEPPKETPFSFLGCQPTANEPIFDPEIHLAIEPPTVVRTLSFQDVPFPYKSDTLSDGNEFAYTPQPFRLLSASGTSALRGIIDHYKPQLLRSNERNESVRGLGYLSPFVRAFTYEPSILKLFSALAAQPVHPHDAVMNHAHTNIGAVGNGKAVDQWHTDSVDFVCIVIVSDTRDMEGGEFQVLQMSDATGSTFDTLKVCA